MSQLKLIATLSVEGHLVCREGPGAIIGSLQLMSRSQLVCVSRRLVMLMICWLVVGLTAKSALALDPNKAITQFIHTSWTEKDGAPTGIRSIVQTADGYLWLGTIAGLLYRFDGVRFVRFEPQAGELLPDTTLLGMLAARDGSLWISFVESPGFRLFNGHLSRLDNIPNVYEFVEAPDGTLVANTEKGLWRLKDGIWGDVSTDWNFTGRQARRVYFDAETNDLAGGLRSATEECVSDQSISVNFLVAGRARDLHPIARDEIFRIGYEAIRNACEHSLASELEVSLNYAQDLTLRVKDNGIGMEASVLADGKEGHFGLQGMRERSERIRSKFTLNSTPNSGTEMTLIVPGNVIFRNTGATLFEKIKSFFGLDSSTDLH